jgi:hypothetical protein
MEPHLFSAIVDEANELGMGTTAHLSQPRVAQMTVRDAARHGLTGMTHFYGLFESLLRDHQSQPYRLDYNYQTSSTASPRWRSSGASATIAGASPGTTWSRSSWTSGSSSTRP